MKPKPNGNSSERFDRIKYAEGELGRPKAIRDPRLDQITLYAIAIERITGKEGPLPKISEQWPALDRTKTPNARPK